MSSYEQAARRVLDRADELATFTIEPGRITRPLLTAALGDAQAQVREWMQAAGLQPREDALGNLAGRRGEAPVLIGSHLDTVADAGRYDGILGILIGLEVAEALPDAALEVIAFADEDGLRFQSIYLGSRAFVGEPIDLAVRDRDGVTLGEALAGCARPAAARGARARATSRSTSSRARCSSPRAWPLGVVTAITGQSRFNLAFSGHAGHAGTTPMHLRRDAAAAAAEFVLAAERVARDAAGPGGDGRASSTSRTARST